MMVQPTAFNRALIKDVPLEAPLKKPAERLHSPTRVPAIIVAVVALAVAGLIDAYENRAGTNILTALDGDNTDAPVDPRRDVEARGVGLALHQDRLRRAFSR